MNKIKDAMKRAKYNKIMRKAQRQMEKGIDEGRLVETEINGITCFIQKVTLHI